MFGEDETAGQAPNRHLSRVNGKKDIPEEKNHAFHHAFNANEHSFLIRIGGSQDHFT